MTEPAVPPAPDASWLGEHEQAHDQLEYNQRLRADLTTIHTPIEASPRLLARRLAQMSAELAATGEAPRQEQEHSAAMRQQRSERHGSLPGS